MRKRIVFNILVFLIGVFLIDVWANFYGTVPGDIKHTLVAEILLDFGVVLSILGSMRTIEEWVDS